MQPVLNCPFWLSWNEGRRTGWQRKTEKHHCWKFFTKILSKVKLVQKVSNRYNMLCSDCFRNVHVYWSHIACITKLCGFVQKLTKKLKCAEEKWNVSAVTYAVEMEKEYLTAVWKAKKLLTTVHYINESGWLSCFFFLFGWPILFFPCSFTDHILSPNTLETHFLSLHAVCSSRLPSLLWQHTTATLAIDNERLACSGQHLSIYHRVPDGELQVQLDLYIVLSLSRNNWSWL